MSTIQKELDMCAGRTILKAYDIDNGWNVLITFTDGSSITIKVSRKQGFFSKLASMFFIT